MATDRKISELRETWERAIGKDRPKDALAALEGLELLEPEEPQWSHRRGDVLRRLGKLKEAENAFVRAIELYTARGFLTRAAALTKAVVELNPGRAALLGELDAAPAKKLRDENRPATTSPLNPRMPPPPRMPSGTLSAVQLPMGAPIPREEGAQPRMPAPIPREDPAPNPRAAAAAAAFVGAAAPKPAPAVAPAAAGRGTYELEDEDDDDDERPTLVAGVRAERLSVIAAAMGLEHAKDANPDEVRFENVPDIFAIDVDVSEIESHASVDDPAAPEVSSFGEEEAPTAVRLALMSGATLFMDVPKNVMGDLVAEAELIDLAHGSYVYRSGERANGLYVLVEGKVQLGPPGPGRKLVLSEGSVFGEDCLLQAAMRNADARVSGRLLALRIPKDSLDRIVKKHATLGDVLFDVLVRRLVTTALQTSSLFAGFDIPTRKDLARLFEVRRASPGIVIKERGKRSDGLYLALAGEFEVDDGGKKTLLPLGTMFGHTSLVSDTPEQRTIRVVKESVVLRLSAARFVSFAARFPAALAHLTELSKAPQAL